jgi:hypothetical protein
LINLEQGRGKKKEEDRQLEVHIFTNEIIGFKIRRTDCGYWGFGRFTSHVFLSFVDYKRISTMLLLLLVGLFILVGVGNDPDLREYKSEGNRCYTTTGHTLSIGPNLPNSLSRSCSVAS